MGNIPGICKRLANPLWLITLVATCGSNSSIWFIFCVGSRTSTSYK